MRRILVYTHDTFGLGHVRRSLHLVRAYCALREDDAVLFVTGNPAGRAVRDLPPNADFMKLPTVVRTGGAASRPPHLPIGARAITSLRKRVLRSTVDQFRPDLLLVDNFPLGSGRELLPVLERAREHGCRTVLGLRDIVDHPDVVRRDWRRQDIETVLRELYDRVLVYGLPEVFDPCEEYGLPDDLRAKLRFCGYVTGPTVPAASPGELRERFGLGTPLVVATVGGGGDGYPLLESFVAAMKQIPEASALALTGPLMGRRERDRLRALTADVDHIVLEEFVSDLPALLAAADAVVAMGGYNTVAELLAMRRPAFVMPRDWRYGEFEQGAAAGVEWEQLLRAQALERSGHLQMLDRDGCDPAALAARLREALTAPPASGTGAVDVAGARRAAEELVALLPTEESHDPS